MRALHKQKELRLAPHECIGWWNPSWSVFLTADFISKPYAPRIIDLRADLPSERPSQVA